MIHISLPKIPPRIPLRLVLIVPFILQLLISVSLVGGLSFYNSQATVHQLVARLLDEVGKNIQQHLDAYLTVPMLIAKLNAQAVQENKIRLGDPASERYLWQLSELTGTINWISFGRETDGGFLGVSRHRRKPGDVEIIIVDDTTHYGAEYYLADSQGRRGPLQQVIPTRFDSRVRPWYQRAAAAGTPIWSQVFLDWSTSRTRIDATVPAYNKQKQLLGVCQAAFYLEDIGVFLKSLPVTQTGMAFVIETSGLLIANSVMEIPFTKDKEGKSQRKTIQDSNHALMHAIATQLPPHLDKLTQPQQQLIELDHDRYFTQLIPYQAPVGGSLNWLIGVVVPEQDFMAQIKANNRTTLILLCFTVLIAIMIGLLTARWITQPIYSLNQAASRLTQKDWEVVLPTVTWIEELGQLSRSFAQMAKQLQQAFLALAQNEQRLQQFLEAMPVGVFVVTPTGEPYYINTRAQQLLGKGVVAQADCADLPTVYQIYLAGTNQLYPIDKQPVYRALLKESIYIDDMEIHSPQRLVPIEVWGSPIVNEQGEVIYALVVFQEITARKQAETDRIHLLQVQESNKAALRYHREIEAKNVELIRLNQEKNEFLGIVAHDLKNPLSGIRGAAELIQEGFDDFSKEEIIEYARLTVNESERMFQLITNLLDVSAIEAGKINLQLEHLNLLSIVQKLVKTYTTRANGKNITLHLNSLEPQYQVLADRNTIEQVLDNLISNAIKYSPPGKSVYIRLISLAQTVRCEVQDEGPGLSKQDQKKLFGKFTRLTPQPTAGEHSTGLGLYIVKRLVEAMQGKVWCESEVGQGARFVIEIKTNRI